VQDALDRHALIDDNSDLLVDTIRQNGDADRATFAPGPSTTRWSTAVWMASGVYDVADNIVITG